MKLNLGCGPCWKLGYTNVDCESPTQLCEWARQSNLPEPLQDGSIEFMQFDLQDPWPWTDGSVDEIIADNVLEHFDHPETHHVLSEARRVLTIGGTIRGEVPDFRRVWEYYEQQRDWAWGPLLTWGPYAAPAANALYNFCYAWGHKQIFTQEMLTERLGQFLTEVTVVPVGEHKLSYTATR